LLSFVVPGPQLGRGVTIGGNRVLINRYNQRLWAGPRAVSESNRQTREEANQHYQPPEGCKVARQSSFSGKRIIDAHYAAGWLPKR